MALQDRTAASLREQLRDALAAYEPGRTDRREAKPAAALLLLYERDDGIHLLFQERSHLVEHHKAEISFPGGARDEGDGSAAFTALRETHEEVGVAPEDVDLLGEIDEIWTRSDFRLRPFVGWLRAVARTPSSSPPRRSPPSSRCPSTTSPTPSISSTTCARSMAGASSSPPTAGVSTSSGAPLPAC